MRADMGGAAHCCLLTCLQQLILTDQHLQTDRQSGVKTGTTSHRATTHLGGSHLCLRWLQVEVCLVDMMACAWVPS